MLLKFVWKLKSPNESQECPEEKEHDGGARGGLAVANTKISYKIIATNSVGCKLRDGQISSGTK